MSPITASHPPSAAAAVGELAVVAADGPADTAVVGGAIGIGARRPPLAGDGSPLWRDVREGLRRNRLWLTLGWNDIRSRYRRTILGPFWTVLSTATLVGALGFVNAVLWNISISTYLPYFCAGYISWLLFLTIINESCSSIIASEAIVKVVRVPYSVFVFRVLTRNVIVFAHNLTIFVLVAAIFGVSVSANTLLFPVGLALAVVNYAWIGLLLAVICARFRDVIQLVTNVTTILFFVTPVFWQPSQLDAAPLARWVLADANFAYHIVDVIRAPLLGNVPEPLSYIYLTATAVLGFVMTALLMRPFYNRIAYWL
jgi:ABC-type polysaccharide/polyol phosphate export permease